MIKLFKLLAAGMLLLGLTGSAFGHGLMRQPASRNWFCGALTKPDQVLNGVAQFPVCGNAFSFDFTGSYNFMSVLTHTLGRDGVGPRDNVCGFNSENWAGGQTPWDQPIDWPTNNLTPGPLTITWDINWGPHFSDTMEFKYWITKPDFLFQVGVPLSFNDFEDKPFCSLPYNDADPLADPLVVPDKANALFHTACTVPQRQGRHVIYGEWGRTPPTFERFHGCIDAVFTGGGGTPVHAAAALTPNVTSFTGAGTIALNASASTGDSLTYQWSVDSENPALYTIDNPSLASTTLHLADPQANGNVHISLSVISATGGTDSTTVNLVHHPSVASPWFDFGPLTRQAQTLNAGDLLSLRTVLQIGSDVFYPPTPVVVTSTTTAPTAWPFALATAVNGLNGNARIGVLNAGQIVPAQDATANRMFALTTSNVAGAFLQFVPGGGGCSVNYQIASQWQTGFQPNVTITNQSPNAINGYGLTWTLGPGEAFTSGFNATFTTSGSTMTASNLPGTFNGRLTASGGTSTFGFQGSKSAAPATIPNDFRLNGIPCTNGNQSTTPDFALSATPASVTVNQGASATSTINVSRTNFTGSVSFSASGLPSGVTAVFSPTPTNGNSTTLTLTASAAAVVGGPIAVTITGSSSGLSHATTLNLTVAAPPTPDFSLSLTPGTLSVAQGGSSTATLNVNRINGFTGAVTLALSPLPTGVSASCSPNPVTGASCVLTVSASSTAPLGAATVTITGTGGGLTRTVSLSLIVTAGADFSLSANPANLSVAPGACVSTTITITRTGGFTGALAFTATGLPAGATATFNPNPATGNTTVLTICFASTTPPGPVTINVTATSGTLSHAIPITVTVGGAPDFSLSANPANLTVLRGASGTSTITVTRLNGFAGAVNFTASGLPVGVTASFNPTATTTTGTTSTLTLTTVATAALATSAITITGTSGTLPVRTTTVNLSVVSEPPQVLTATPVVATNSAFFNEEDLRLANTSPLTALTVTITIQRTTGVSFSGQYNTAGGTITQANSSTASTVTYTYTLNAGQTLGIGTNWTFAAQTGGTGTIHPTAGDTFTVIYTVGGQNFTQTGHF